MSSPVEGGWYECDLSLESSDEHALFDPVLYPDYGQGPSEQTSIPLPFAAEPAIHDLRVVRFVGEASTIRLDPTSMLGTFELAPEGAFRRLSKFEAAVKMFKAVIRVEPTVKSKVVVCRELVLRLCTGGVRHMADWLYGRYKLIGSGQKRLDVTYQSWIQLYDVPAPPREFSREPLISIVLPVYNTEERWLRRCIESVIGQRYTNWELCICNDASTTPDVREILEEYRSCDPRIGVIHREANGHISAASNDALSLAAGEFVGLLDHDDELHLDALYEVVAHVNDHPDAGLIFTDEDKIDQYGLRYDPYFKPDWNPDLFLGHNCVSHFGVYRRDLMQRVGGFRIGMEGSQDWDLALRCSEGLTAEQIVHIPRVLYHWRAIPGSTALAPGEKSYAHFAGLKAVNEHLQRREVLAQAVEIQGRSGNYRVNYGFEVEPSVTIIIPTRDRVGLLRKCVESILERTNYQNYSILVIDNQSSEPETLKYLSSLDARARVRVARYDEEFNYSAINNFAVDLIDCDVVVLLNNDIEVISPGWLNDMVANAVRPDVGAVGAMLYYPNDTIQHAGVVIGVHGIAGHAYSGKPRGWAGQMNRGGLAQNYSAVTAACLAVRREVFLEVGGFSEELRVAFNDVDFCLKLRDRGYWNVWLPWVELYHHESATRGYEDTPEKKARFEREVKWMAGRWPKWLSSDPAYNPNLSLDGDPFSLSFPPRYMRSALDTSIHAPTASSEGPGLAVG
ncbi:glycosyltransferase family 2 protein [Luteimonas sp. A478]